MRRVNVVYALLYNEETEQVLMVYNKEHNFWSMPGGAVEENETLEQATIREVKEETGLLVKIRDIVSINECYFQEDSEHTLFITFRTEIVGGEIFIENPDEIAEIKWVDIPVADKLMPYHKNGINELIRNSATYCFQV